MKHCYNHKCTVIYDQDDCPICEDGKLANEIVENLCNQVDEQKVKVMELQERNNILSIALEKAIKRPHITIYNNPEPCPELVSGSDLVSGSQNIHRPPK